MSIQQYFYMLGGGTPIRGAMVTDSAATTLVVTVDQAISWDTEVNDWGGYFDAGSPTLFTVPSDAAGYHLITSNLTHDLGTANWYSNNYVLVPTGIQGLFENPVTSALDNSRSYGVLKKMTAAETAANWVNWFSGTGSRTIEAGGQFAIGKIWADPVVGGMALRNTTQVIPSLTPTVVTFALEVVDDGGMVDIAGQPTRLTIPTAGWYIVTGQARWGTTSTFSSRKTYIRKNGAAPYVAVNYNVVGIVTGTHSLPACGIAYFAASDYLQLLVLNGQAINQSLSANAYLMAAKVDMPETIGAHVTYSGSAQTVNTGSDVLIIFDTEDQDDDGMVDLGSQAGRITCTEDGLYAIAGHVGVNDVGNVSSIVKLKLNGSTVIAEISSVHQTTLNPVVIYYLTAGQYISMYCNVATNTSTLTGDDRPMLGMVLLAKG